MPVILIFSLLDCSVCQELSEDLDEAAYAVTRYPLKVDKKPPRDEGTRRDMDSTRHLILMLLIYRMCCYDCRENCIQKERTTVSDIQTS